MVINILWLNFYFSKKEKNTFFHTINLTVSFANSLTDIKQIRQIRLIIKKRNTVYKITIKVYVIEKPKKKNPQNIQLYWKSVIIITNGCH